MPTTATKNLIYRSLLPFLSPNCGNDPLCGHEGHPLTSTGSFEHLIKKHHVLGSALLISDQKHKAVVYTSSVSPSHHASSETYFRVASITKMATAALTLHLYDRGIIDIDCPISSYIPDTDPFFPEPITLRQLLSHTSGLADPPTLGKDLEEGKPFTDLLMQSQIQAPGISFRYSNLGYGLIGSVLEAVLNLPLGALFREYLFEPLCMNATLEGATLPQDQIMPVTRILPYRKGTDLVLTPLGRKPLNTVDPLRHYGHTAGSMYTDILSLHRLIQVLIQNGGNYLADQILNMMKTQHAVYGAVSPSLSYGLGLLIINDKRLSGGRIIGHQGFAYGCADGAFWEEETGRELIFLNGGCSEARTGRLGKANADMIRWAFRKELPAW